MVFFGISAVSAGRIGLGGQRGWLGNDPVLELERRLLSHWYAVKNDIIGVGKGVHDFDATVALEQMGLHLGKGLAVLHLYARFAPEIGVAGGMNRAAKLREGPNSGSVLMGAHKLLERRGLRLIFGQKPLFGGFPPNLREARFRSLIIDIETGHGCGGTVGWTTELVTEPKALLTTIQ
jgi:hypothetical protein